MSRGRPFEPGNQHGHGRPKGTPNKKVQQAQQLLEQNSPALMAMAINRSRKDPKMRRLLVSRIMPRQAELPVRIGRLPISALADLDQAAAMTLQMATSGKISPSESHDLARLIENRRDVLKALDLERRLHALESERISGRNRPKRFQGSGEEMMALFWQSAGEDSDKE
jgi:hypothetical protein